MRNLDSRRVACKSAQVDVEEQPQMASAKAETWQVISHGQRWRKSNKMSECCDMAEGALATRRADNQRVSDRRLGCVQHVSLYCSCVASFPATPGTAASAASLQLQGLQFEAANSRVRQCPGWTQTAAQPLPEPRTC